MISFKEYMDIKMLFESEMIDEASMGRFVQHLDKGEPVAIISADRGERSKKQNMELFEKLKKQALTNGFGFNFVKGGYVEKNDDTGEERDVDGENSIIIYATPDREKELYKFSIGVGKQFNQDSIFFHDSKGRTDWVSTRDDGYIGKVGSKEDVGDFHPEQKGKYYSKIGKRKFSFTPKKVDYDPDTMDIEYYALDRKGRETPLGRNEEGKKLAAEYEKKHRGCKTTTKLLYKNTNRPVKIKK